MSKYLFVYHGGKMPETKEAQAASMDQWGKWFSGLGDAVVDGGNPVGKSITVMGDKSVVDHGGANPASGYSVVQGDSLEAALTMAKGCPILQHGGNVEVAPIIDM